MAKFEIAGVQYQSKMLDGETQILVMKRVMPVVTALGSVAKSLGESFALSGEPIDKVERVAEMLKPAAVEVSKIDDADVTFIMNACLDVTERTVAIGTGWVPVRQGGRIQDPADQTFHSRLLITWNVLRENLAGMSGFLGIVKAGA